MVKSSIIYVIQFKTFFFVGWYWIDPNLGMMDDAIYVYCNMSAEGETCVFPDIHSSTMPNIPWRKNNNKNDWYSNLRGGFKVKIKIRIETNIAIFVIVLDNLRNDRCGPNDFLETVVSRSVPEFYVHLHQQCCMVQFEKFQVRHVHQTTWRKRSGIFVQHNQTFHFNRWLQIEKEQKRNGV